MLYFENQVFRNKMDIEYNHIIVFSINDTHDNTEFAHCKIILANDLEDDSRPRSAINNSPLLSVYIKQMGLRHVAHRINRIIYESTGEDFC